MKNKKYFLLNLIKSHILNGDSENIDAKVQKKVRSPALRRAGAVAKQNFQNNCIALNKEHFAAFRVPCCRKQIPEQRGEIHLPTDAKTPPDEGNFIRRSNGNVQAAASEKKHF